MNKSLLKTVLAGLAGGVALNVSMALTFRLLGFGWNGGGILLDPAWQSDKLIAVWTRLEPLPLIVVNPTPMLIGLMLFGAAHAIIYRWLAAGWPPGVIARAWRMAALVFVLSFLFFEFFTPFNLFGEPAPLVGLELIFWAMIAMTESFAIAVVFEKS